MPCWVSSAQQRVGDVKPLSGPAQPAWASRGAPSRSLRLGGKLRRLRTHHAVAWGGNRLVVVATRSGIGSPSGPPHGPGGTGLGVGCGGFGWTTVVPHAGGFGRWRV